MAGRRGYRTDGAERWFRDWRTPSRKSISRRTPLSVTGGISERETRVLKRGEETQLEHGSGIGLWLAAWVVDASDGELSFARPDDGGSVASISLPHAKTE